MSSRREAPPTGRASRLPAPPPLFRPATGDAPEPGLVALRRLLLHRWPGRALLGGIAIKFIAVLIEWTAGASVFTGGAVRYRIYSAWDLTAIDVAKICFIAGLTFWLGNATVLGSQDGIPNSISHTLTRGLGIWDDPPSRRRHSSRISPWPSSK